MNLKNKLKVIVFDFDGVLVDSYSCLGPVYAYIAERIGLKGSARDEFVKKAIKYEDEQDALGNYDRKKWWPNLFKEFNILINEQKLDELLQIFWEKRAEESGIVKDCEKILRYLKEIDIKLAIMAGDDGRKSLKRRRIEKSGLSKFFDKILIVGEDVKNRIEGIELIKKEYELSEGDKILLVDDKPSPINEVANLKDVVTVKVEFEGPLKLAWAEECNPRFRIKTIGELKDIVEMLLQ
ncbi:HAD family hydrolase [Archaeoglobus veneficus]|uniref:Haloacid dehalogenase domain protein hydrolase n=1 Tax=Archaeoglobus veneficus (strain DSM 11195 / SNP6) TaxID=693661 RepID=F2KSN1_ARCVS|nr:HAD family hydrolase [Archaeoglobus veneficus]AEA48101.1 Haloacid dehalogenase domain protein hydrolase [Archaeoglobus veneficus SNP6]